MEPAVLYRYNKRWLSRVIAGRARPQSGRWGGSGAVRGRPEAAGAVARDGWGLPVDGDSSDESADRLRSLHDCASGILGGGDPRLRPGPSIRWRAVPRARRDRAVAGAGAARGLPPP